MVRSTALILSIARNSDTPAPTPTHIDTHVHTHDMLEKALLTVFGGGGGGAEGGGGQEEGGCGQEEGASFEAHNHRGMGGLGEGGGGGGWRGGGGLSGSHTLSDSLSDLPNMAAVGQDLMPDLDVDALGHELEHVLRLTEEEALWFKRNMGKGRGGDEGRGGEGRGGEDRGGSKVAASYGGEGGGNGYEILRRIGRYLMAIIYR